MLLKNQILLILCIFIKSNIWYSWSLKILPIKKWFPFNFAKYLQGRHFVVDRPKISRHLVDISFESCLSKYCIFEFTAIFVCFLLSWSRRYSMKWSSNFDPYTPIPQFFKYDKPLPKYLIHSIFNENVSNLYFEKGAAKKTHKFFRFLKGRLFCNGWSYWQECFRVWRDFCGLSKKYGVPTFPEM